MCTQAHKGKAPAAPYADEVFAFSPKQRQFPHYSNTPTPPSPAQLMHSSTTSSDSGQSRRVHQGQWSPAVPSLAHNNKTGTANYAHPTACASAAPPFPDAIFGGPQHLQQAKPGAPFSSIWGPHHSGQANSIEPAVPPPLAPCRNTSDGCSTSCSHLDRCHILEEELSKAKKDLSEAVAARETTNSELVTLQAYVNQLTHGEHLHTAIPCQSEPSSHNLLKQELDQTFAENQCLQEEIRHLRMQLQSLENILQLQEKAAGSAVTPPKHKPYDPSHKPKGPCGEKSELTTGGDRLLKAWRHQVMRLLMQRASHEEASAREKVAIQAQLNKQADQLLSLEAQTRALNAKLVAKDAALEENSRLTEDFSQEVLRLNHCLQASNNCNTHLTEVTKTSLKDLRANLVAMNVSWSRIFASDDGDTASGPLLKRLRSLERRLQFANGRLPMIRSLLSRKASREGVSRRSLGIQVSGGLRLPPLNEVLPDCVEDLKELLQAAWVEIAQTIADRDSLSRKLLEDAQYFNEQSEHMKREHMKEIGLLKQQMTEANGSLKAKMLELESSEARLHTLDSDYRRLLNESMETKARLETDLANVKADRARSLIATRRAERLAHQATNERQAQVADLEQEHREQMGHLKAGLREATQHLLLAPQTSLGRGSRAFTVSSSYLTPLRPGEVFGDFGVPIGVSGSHETPAAVVAPHKSCEAPTRLPVAATTSEAAPSKKNQGEDTTSHLDGSVLESLSGHQIESVRATLRKLATLAQQLEQDDGDENQAIRTESCVTHPNKISIPSNTLAAPAHVSSDSANAESAYLLI